MAAAACRADEKIADLIHDRLALMQDVAAFKYLRDVPVDDKDREAVVLERAQEQAHAAGLNGETMAPFFTAQIEAAKAVQSCWIDRWRSAVAPAPTDAPDLANDIRPRLIGIGDALVMAIAETARAGNTVELKAPPVVDCLPQEAADAIAASLAGIATSR